MGRVTDEAPAEDRPPTMKERARKARHEAYAAAKERRKNDPRTSELKARARAARREASAKARERRKTDPKQIALKEKLKQDRRDASAREKTRRAEARTPRAATATRGPVLELVHSQPEGGAAVECGARPLGLVRAALTVIEGGKSPKIEKA